MTLIHYKVPDGAPWTAWDEIRQRIGNVRRMLMFAWLAARHDSTAFAVVFYNSVRDAGDGLIAVTMKNGTRVDPERIHDLERAVRTVASPDDGEGR